MKTVSDAISSGTISAEEMTRFEKFAENAETKKVALNNGDALYVRIIGFDHDTRAGREAKAGITFMAVNSINQGYYNGNKDDAASTYAIGWNASSLRKKLQQNGEVFALLPTELTDRISAVTKHTRSGWTSKAAYVSQVYDSIDSLFLLSGSELGTDLYGSDEGSKYEYIDCVPASYPQEWAEYSGVLFQNVNSSGYECIAEYAGDYANIDDMYAAIRAAGGISDALEQGVALLRSAHPEASDYYGGIRYDGELRSVRVDLSTCVAPCFCI